VHVSQGFWAGHTVHFSIAFERPKNTEDSDDSTEDNQDLRVQTIPDGRIFEECIRRYGDDIPQLEKLLAKLIPYGRTVRYRKGEHYLEFGETSPNVGVIIDGMFRQYAITDEGKDCTISLLRPGQIFQPTTHSIYEESESLALEAVCGSRVFVIDTRYTEPLSHDTRWYELLYRAVQERLLEAKRRAVSLLNENAAMRYDRFLREEGDAADLLHSYQIASYLGITAETLSRIRKRKKQKQ
jgi:CRP-like cAMP-binding protein